MLTVPFGESTMSRTQVQLQYKRLKEGQEEANYDACPGPLSTSTTDENIEAMKKMILNNRQSLLETLLMLMLAYCSAHAKQFHECFRHETYDCEECSKITKF